MILVMLREWSSYGYELLERTTAFGFEAMNPGTLYRTLREMEKNGAVKSTWDSSKGGPARRVYSITDAGEAYLGFWARSLEQYQRNVDVFFRLYSGRSRQANEKKDDQPGRDPSFTGLRSSSALKISVSLIDNEVTGLARSPYNRAY